MGWIVMKIGDRNINVKKYWLHFLFHKNLDYFLHFIFLSSILGCNSNMFIIFVINASYILLFG